MNSYSIDQAAEMLAVSRRTIYNRIRDGRLRTTRTLGHSSQRVTAESLVEQGWLPQLESAGPAATMMSPTTTRRRL